MRCTECEKIADGKAWGWRSYLAADDPPDGALFVAHYCPECAEREFGDTRQGAELFD